MDGYTINAEQAVNWLHSVGYTETLVNRPLTTDEIKKQLDASDPIIPILTNQNEDNWLDKNLAGVLYAHDDVAIDGDQKLNKSFIETIGLVETMIQDGEEDHLITFPEQTSALDPIQANDSYLWTQTIINVKQDPHIIKCKNTYVSDKDFIFLIISFRSFFYSPQVTIH